MKRWNLKSIFYLTIVIALLFGWYVDHYQLKTQQEIETQRTRVRVVVKDEAANLGKARYQIPPRTLFLKDEDEVDFLLRFYGATNKRPSEEVDSWLKQLEHHSRMDGTNWDWRTTDFNEAAPQQVPSPENSTPTRGADPIEHMQVPPNERTDPQSKISATQPRLGNHDPSSAPAKISSPVES